MSALTESFGERATHAAAPRGARAVLRRTLFVVLLTSTLGFVSLELLDLIRVNGTTPLEVVIFVLTILLLAPIVVSFWMAVMGFIVKLGRHDPSGLDLAEDDTRTAPLTVPVAIVIPIFNEDPERVVAGLEATRESLERTEEEAAFEFFVLSDTMDPQRWLEEERVVTALRASWPDPDRLHYRNRPRNAGKKAGNIAEFCRTYGDRFRYMIVFDADSVMAGTTLVRLVRLMERHPEVGIIQAPPVPVNRRTLFGRVQQFAARAYGPTWAAGLAYLQCGEGNYYGHNAILRIAPFVEHCRLPRLPGKGPLGGAVLSHDFVEAALMRRAGYRVHLAANLGGSFEEPPPTLINFAARDRRWCQGNLQHARLLGLRGLHPVSRLHLAMGIIAYLSSPLWILLLALSTAEVLRGQLSEHQYFAPGGALFPIWQVSVATQAALLFAIVMAFLFVPRALAVIACLLDPVERQRFGGGPGLALSAACECIFSVLLAPVMAITQSMIVIGIMMGRTSGWESQTRSDRGTTLAEALRRQGGVTALGIAWAFLLWRFSPDLLGWMVPVLAGMILAVPLSMLSSRVSAGEWARSEGLLLTPEELAPTTVLRRWREKLAQLSERSQVPDPRTALERVLADADVRASHLTFTADHALEDPLEEHVVQGLVLKCRVHGPAALTDAEQRQLLLVPQALEDLLHEAGDVAG